MIMVRFRSKEEHGDILHKVKKMKKFTEELEDMLEECLDDGYDFREDDYYPEYEDGRRVHGRYGYRRGRM